MVSWSARSARISSGPDCWHGACAADPSEGSYTQSEPDPFKGSKCGCLRWSRSQSSVHGLLCANTQTVAHVNQMSSGGFAHAEHKSIIRTCCASTWSRLSLFLMLIGGQMLSGGTQCHFTTFRNSFQSMSEKPVPALMLWACNIGLDKGLHHSSIPHLSLRHKFW